MNNGNIIQLNIAVNRFVSGSISRTELSKVASELYSQIEDKKIKKLLEEISEWSVHQAKKDFISTRESFYKYYQTINEIEFNDELDSNTVKYLSSIGLPTNSEVENIKPVIKKAISDYFENKFSEIFLESIASYLMNTNPGDGFNVIKDKVLLGLLMILQDWFITSRNTENSYIETELKEYLEFGTGFKAMDQEDIFEEDIKPFLEAKQRADELGKTKGLSNEKRQALRNYIIRNKLSNPTDEELEEIINKFL